MSKHFWSIAVLSIVFAGCTGPMKNITDPRHPFGVTATEIDPKQLRTVTERGGELLRSTSPSSRYSAATATRAWSTKAPSRS